MKRLLALTLLLAIIVMLVPSFASAEQKEEKAWEDKGLVERFIYGMKKLFDGEKKEKKKGYAQKSESGEAGDLMIDNLIPQDKAKKKVGKITVMPNQYSPSRYQLDLWVKKGYWIDDAAIEGAASTWHGFNNGLWSLNVSSCYVIYWMMDEFQKNNVVAEKADDVEEGIQTLAGFTNGTWRQGVGIWGMLLPIMLMLAAGYIGWKAMGQNDEMSAKSAAFKSILVILFSFAYFTYASAVITTPVNIVMGIRNATMALGASAMKGEIVTPAEAVAASTNNLHKIMIDNDWRMLQWGSTDVDDVRVKAILDHPQSSEIRKRAVELEATPVKEGGMGNKNMTMEASFIRTFFIGGSIVKNVFIGIVVSILALAGYIFQLLYLFLALLGPLALIWAVNPKMIHSAEKWAAEGLGALMMIFAIGVVLAVYFLASDLLYRMYEEDGYIMIVISQLCLIALLIWKRSVIFNLATSPAMSLVGKVGEAETVDRMLNMASRYLRMKRWNDRRRDRRGNRGRKHRDDSMSIEPDVDINGNVRESRPSLQEGQSEMEAGQEQVAATQLNSERPSLKNGENSEKDGKSELERHAEEEADYHEQARRQERLEKLEKETDAGEPIRPDEQEQRSRSSLPAGQQETDSEEQIPSDVRSSRPSLYSMDEGEKK